MQLSHLQSLGIRYFEPRTVNGKNISELTDEEAHALRDRMDYYGIGASSIGSPIGKIGISDDFDRHAAADNPESMLQVLDSILSEQ